MADEPYIKIYDHEDQGINLLISQFKGRYRIEGWLKSVLHQIQDLEDANFEVGLAFLIDTAVDTALDALGVIVGQPRNGMSNDLYRIFIKAKIAVNRSSGTPYDIQTIAKLLDTDPGYLEQYPASITVYLSQDLSDLSLRASINTIMQQGKPAGVSLDVIDTGVAGEFPLRLSTAYNAPINNSPYGLSSVHGTVPTGSGKLVSIILS